MSADASELAFLLEALRNHAEEWGAAYDQGGPTRPIDVVREMAARSPVHRAHLARVLQLVRTVRRRPRRSPEVGKR
jgi:hypothetical protein